MQRVRLILENIWVFPWSKASNKIGDTELDENISHSTTDGWIRLEYVQGFYFEVVTFKQSIKMFEKIEIADNIFEGILDPYYKTSD